MGFVHAHVGRHSDVFALCPRAAVVFWCVKVWTLCQIERCHVSLSGYWNSRVTCVKLGLAAAFLNSLYVALPHSFSLPWRFLNPFWVEEFFWLCVHTPVVQRSAKKCVPVVLWWEFLFKKLKKCNKNTRCLCTWMQLRVWSEVRYNRENSELSYMNF